MDDSPGPLLVILVSGFLDQSFGRAVLHFEEAFREAYPGLPIHRFTFTSAAGSSGSSAASRQVRASG